MNTLPPACVAYQTELLEQLDQRVTVLPDSPHLLECPYCQALRQSAVTWLMVPVPAVPPMNPARTERIVAELQKVANAQRRGRRLAWLTAAVLFVLVVTSLCWPGRSNRPGPFPSVPTASLPQGPLPMSPTPKIEETLSDAGAALVSVTRHTTEQTLRPAQSLLSWPNSLPMTSGDTEMALESAAEPLRSLPNSARSGIDPVANGTKRAMTRIFRDLSAWNPAKPKS